MKELIFRLPFFETTIIIINSLAFCRSESNIFANMDYHRNYRPCSTFFVEDEYGMDTRMRQERQAKEEHQKLVSRERQRAMAEELSHITSDELRDDVLAHMMEMDVSSG